MANIDTWIKLVMQDGYSTARATAKVSQDIILRAIEASDFGRNITVKGGVVMHSITGNARRATLDMDLDFIRYSLEEESMRWLLEESISSLLEETLS